ncbi:type II toxin-antitoxin system RelE/ParE family toxin [Devosia elaeis]|uniref:Plasmid stabilization protein n=1 Tax=Devosia elaeis TaxID=1770058 RepID=A0A178HYB9_9HYPH|nr:type II toxin-antitoxin system RelE/ParE family toxin [Devosia elaeis]OAM77821.1 hypothetical protein A3840_08270 [Devosia elaeis]
MRMRLARQAADYIRQEAQYLRARSPAAAMRFLEQVRSVRRDLEQHSQAGFASDDLPIPGLRRLIRDGYRFDYRLTERFIEVAAISSSVNTPLTGPSDDPDFDYEL